MLDDLGTEVRDMIVTFKKVKTFYQPKTQRRDANWYGFSVFRTENLCKYGNTIYAIQSTDYEKKKKKKTTAERDYDRCR